MNEITNETVNDKRADTGADSGTDIRNARAKLGSRDYAMAALCAALMAVCSWIAIPATVPFTLQTFGVFLTVGLLGGRRGTLAITVYLLLGAVGAPVFTGFAGGLGYMMGPTGGYIVGFLFSALTMWGIESACGRKNPAGIATRSGNEMSCGSRSRFSGKALTFSMAAGLLVCYAFGTAWFMIVYTKNTGDIGLLTALGWCVFPYIIPDVIKIVLASLLTRRLRPLIGI